MHLADLRVRGRAAPSDVACASQRMASGREIRGDLEVGMYARKEAVSVAPIWAICRYVGGFDGLGSLKLGVLSTTSGNGRL